MMKGRCRDIRKSLFLFRMIVFICILLSGSVEAKIINDGELEKEYLSYINRKNLIPPWAYSIQKPKFCLINLDSNKTKEFIVQYLDGNRTHVYFLRYKNKVRQIYETSGVTGIYRKKKTICLSFSAGAGKITYSIFVFTGTRFKKIEEYRSYDYYNNEMRKTIVSFFHNNDTISEKEFMSFTENVNKFWKNISPFSVGKEL